MARTMTHTSAVGRFEEDVGEPATPALDALTSRTAHCATSMRALLSAAVVLLVSCAAEPEDAPQTRGGGGGATSSSSSKASLPLLGGTVAVSVDDEEVLVSDPDRDTLFFVDLSHRTVHSRLKLPDGSTPTRAVDDGAGHWVVTLRGSGKVAIVDQSTRKLARLVEVCGEPRGVSRALGGGVLVVCATGELVSVQASGEVASRFIGVEGRDVIQNQAGTWVSSFRSAELVEVTTETPTREHAAAANTTQQGVSFAAQVAYRTLERPNGDVVMVHQLERVGETTATIQPPTPVTVPVRMSAYGAPFVAGQPPPPCPGSSMRTGVTVFSGGGSRTFEVPGVLPVDAALSADGRQLAIANAANHEVTLVPDLFATPSTITLCGPANQPPPRPEQPLPFEQPVGVAFLKSGRLLVHFRAQQVLQVREGQGTLANIGLGTALAEDPGQRLFHTSTGSISCASCHPEGLEDGHTWTVRGAVRRTQSLAGGLLSTAPFHWQGDHATLANVMEDTFVTRMGGVMPDDATVTALGEFLDRLPAPKPLAPAVAVNDALGRAAFLKANCQSCHAGPRMMTNSTMSVGRGEAFQVPSLVGVSRRGPWMHDGCAKTLRARLVDPACGGDRHGEVTRLAPDELDALISWLETR